MRKTPVLVVVVGLLAAGLSTGWAPGPAGATTCSGTADTGDNVGTVTGECYVVTPGSPPATGGSTTPAALWATWCEGPTGLAYVSGGVATPPTFGYILTESQETYHGLDPSGTYGLYYVSCGSDTTGSTTFVPGYVYSLVYEITPAVDASVLRDEAVARIDPPYPDPGTNPPHTGDRFGIVNLATWLWVGSWEAVTASETQGLVTVEVAATPTAARWWMGDGGAVACAGPGVAWTIWTHNGGSYCTYTYTSSSADLPGEVYQASVTVTYRLDWWLNGAHQGSFGTLDRATGFEMPVGEIQAVEVGD